MVSLIALRPSQRADAEQFYFITELTMRSHIMASGGNWVELHRREEAAEDATNPGASVVMVGTDEAGILVVERLSREIQLHALYLLPSFQGLGVGSTLVSSLQQEAMMRRVPLCLQVLKVNPAKTFYERLDFSIVKDTEHFYHMQYPI
jgi:ribosomal protein S18 acetylase RimI-like enzyme